MGMVREIQRADCSDQAFSPRVWGWSGTPMRLLVPPIPSFSPRVWGWSRGPVARSGRCDLCSSPPRVWGWSRICLCWYSMTSLTFSPRVWGWSGQRHAWLDATVARFCPTACGDGPAYRACLRQLWATAFSPRVWGWSAVALAAAPGEQVLPTRVGMVRAAAARRASVSGSPHACGDGPKLAATAGTHKWFSPRVWGWSAD